MEINAILQHELVKSGIIILVALMAAYLIQFFMKNTLRKLTEKTKTNIDDEIIQKITKPVYALVLIAGLNLALKEIKYIEQYSTIISGIYFTISAIIVAIALARVSAIIISNWLKVQQKYSKTPRLINGVITIIIYILAAAVILEHFDIKITPFLAALGVGGLAVGLALQNTLSNLFAGIHLISDRPINVGDFIHIDGNLAGTVEDIGWRSTKIRQLNNTLVIIPNGKLSESTIINNTLPEQETSLVIQCGVDYGSNLEKVEKVTIETAEKIQKTTKGAVKTHKPFIRYHTFADSNINFSIILRTEKYTDKYLVTHEFIKALKKSYDKNKIEISWPVRKIVK